MVTTIQVQKYAWVVNLLRDRKKLTLREIKEAWENSSLSIHDGPVQDRKTWYKCFDDIGLIFGIIIDVTPKTDGSKWYIVNPDALRGHEVEKWMLGCVSYRNLLEELMGMYNRADIEGFPSENGMLSPIVKAMKGNLKLEVLYRKYGFQKAKRYIVEPHFIKTYNHRFYVLCKFDTGFYFTLSFDRMLEAKVLNEHFNFPDNLFAKEFFEEFFGVMIPGNDMETVDIVVRAKGNAPYYLEDKPLHNSQRILKETTEYVDFVYKLKPTEDFIGAIMQQGERLEIMSPDNVRSHICERLKNALAPYIAA